MTRSQRRTGGVLPLVRGGVVVAVAALLAGCVSPARDDPSYRGKATSALQAAASDVATGLLVVQQDRQKKVLTTYADETVSASETSIGSISQSFGSVQPPDQGSDGIRDAVTGVISKAQDALSHARIAVRRSNPKALAASEAELRDVAKALDTAEQDLG
jgi:hypothetical protein